MLVLVNKIRNSLTDKMIISASRRTDIPAFYAEWFINRIRAGFCAVPNPFNRTQVTNVSLLPEDVEVIVFWTRNPRPLFPHLQELDRLGYRYYFQYTITANPREIDQKAPPTETAVRTFQELSALVGSEKLIWRYDPIVLSNRTDSAYHIRAYREIAEALNKHTQRSVISVMDHYSKSRRRMDGLSKNGYYIYDSNAIAEALPDLVPALVSAANRAGMEIVSCAEEINLDCFGVRPGKCVDNDFIQRVFGVEVAGKKDPSQRKECGCVVSKDIGMYDSCLFGCQYCYATQSFDQAQRNHTEHDPKSPSLIGWHEPSRPITTQAQSKKEAGQLKLFEE